MDSIAEKIRQEVLVAARSVSFDVSSEMIRLEHPGAPENGDYSTNIAMVLAKKYGKNPKDLAEKLVSSIPKHPLIERAEAAGAGFINFYLSPKLLLSAAQEIIKNKQISEILAGKNVMVEFAHPNTHKEMHIGHMRTLITGEALSRIFEAAGATVFRANYQGDIGPHVAKAIWGTRKILEKRKMSWAEADKLSFPEKAHLLGEGYVLGNSEYEKNKEEIDKLNSDIYRKEPAVWEEYERTRKWSLYYYSEFYGRFYTKFNKLYFESEIADEGKKIVLANVGKVFDESDGAVIFKGEKYGLHTRVFITADGNPTYEAKEMGLAPAQYADFPFDRNIHVVANEQKGYFEVAFKALELIDPKFAGREFHLSMGMVNLIGKKISSRTGVIITVDGLLDDVKNLLRPLIKENAGISETEKNDILEAGTIAAVKYSVLKSSPAINVAFDISRSVSLEGDSGPYLQYTYARAGSVLRKAGKGVVEGQKPPEKMSPEEIALLRFIYRFPEAVEAAATSYSPNIVCNYLYELSQKFNNFYNSNPILGNENEGFRLLLTTMVAGILKRGLDLLGIKAPERM